MHKEKFKHHEKMHGPHFTEECAHKAVKKMENEDGSKGPRWSVEEAERIAMQHGVNLSGEKFNKYDWFVALNMIRSDFYRAVVNMTGSDNVKHFVELTKAWLNDKDIEAGKMWFYFKYVMCEEGHEDDDDDDYEESGNYARGRRGRMSMNTYNVGTITLVGQPYDDMTNITPYNATQPRRKLIDITITCEGVLKKLTVGADKTTITDHVIGLTVSTDKNELVTLVTNLCRDYEQKIKAIEYYKDELRKCHELLDLLGDKPIQHNTTETIKVS